MHTHGHGSVAGWGTGFLEHTATRSHTDTGTTHGATQTHGHAHGHTHAHTATRTFTRTFTRTRAHGHSVVGWGTGVS